MTDQRTGILTDLARGALAGAVGTATLNTVTYLDMALRGRAASSVPAKAAGILADRLDLEPLTTETDTDQAKNRREAVGALLGYATGIGVGVAYGLVRPRLRGWPRAGLALTLGLAAMAAGDAPIALTGASDPRTWAVKDWLTDLVPHLAYGLAAATAFDATAAR